MPNWYYSIILINILVIIIIYLVQNITLHKNIKYNHLKYYSV